MITSRIWPFRAAYAMTVWWPRSVARAPCAKWGGNWTTFWRATRGPFLPPNHLYEHPVGIPSQRAIRPLQKIIYTYYTVAVWFNRFIFLFSMLYCKVLGKAILTSSIEYTQISLLPCDTMDLFPSFTVPYCWTHKLCDNNNLWTSVSVWRTGFYAFYSVWLLVTFLII